MIYAYGIRIRIILSNYRFWRLDGTNGYFQRCHLFVTCYTLIITSLLEMIKLLKNIDQMNKVTNITTPNALPLQITTKSRQCYLYDFPSLSWKILRSTSCHISSIHLFPHCDKSLRFSQLPSSVIFIQCLGAKFTKSFNHQYVHP